MQNSKLKILVPIIFLFSIFHFPLSVYPQVQPIYDQGAVGLGQLLKRLNNTKSVMMIAAHPDDEDSSLLAFLARGENARTAYLSLTRGDGGQNVIGPELFESLGVIRTEELLQARRLDGAEQYFTRAFDYGFSKTLTEAKSKWDEKEILCDAVQAIRAFRPLVVISRFSGTPVDGHGQHQYAGYLAPLAVKAAADPMQCQQSGAEWQVLKFYVGQGFRSTEEPTLKINTGKYDFLIGRSYAEIAAEGRSQHKTQEQGGLELKGDRFSGLNLVESKVPKVANEKSVFDGIDVSIINAPKIFAKDEKTVSDYTKETLVKVQESADRALREYDTGNPAKIVPILIEGRKVLNQLNFSYVSFSGPTERIEAAYKRAAAESGIGIITWKKLFEFDKAIKLALGVRIDVLATQETVTQGETFLTSVKVFYPENPNIKFKEIKLNTQNNWQISSAEEPKNDSPFARFFRETADESAFFNVKIPAAENITQPYFLESPRNGYLYTSADSAMLNQPFKYSLMNGYAMFEVYGEIIYFDQPVEYRFADGVRGEVRRELNVVPRISVSLDQDLLIVPNSDKVQTRKIFLNVQNNSSSAFSGSADLKLPDGWKVEQDFGVVQLDKKDESRSFAFNVIIPANTKAGSYEIAASVKGGEETYSQTMHTIAYPHIQTHRFYTDAKTKIEVLDLKVADVKVGYIMGSGDTVPDAIRQMGLNVELLSENDLSGGDLSRFDVIVAGIRAYNVRQDLISNNQRILNYVNGGGTLIVQYQRPDYVSNNLTPFPAKMDARVVDENAKITILDTNSPVFNFPNKINDSDWANWVQERNLYSFTEFDVKYKPLLEAHDVNEPENKGGMVYADYGKGKYVYTSYAFFRQLPAGVPGAYRLFANLLSLPKNRK